MDTEVSQTASTGITTPTLERSVERLLPDPDGRRDTPDSPSKPKALSALGRTLAALARWVLFIALAVSAPVGLIVWSATPRATSPSQLADKAIESGLTDELRVAMVEQLVISLVEGEDSPLPAGELRPVIEDGFSQEWFDDQLTLLADELDGWLGASSDELPDLVIDLSAVKDTMAADDQALSLIAESMDCIGPRCPSPELALADMLAEMPDEVALLTIGDESDAVPGPEVLEARDQFRTVDRLIAVVPLVLAAALVAIVLLARRGSRIRWLGATLVVIAVPVFAVATVLPGWVSGWLTGLVPDELQLNRATLEEVFNWVIQPTGSVARWMLLAGVAALVTSVVLDIRRRWASNRMALSTGSLRTQDTRST